MTSSSTSQPIVFYDIAMRPPVEESACSPNPWKARLALNFKGVPYKTTWVPLPDVAKTRKSLNVPACRKFADGTDFYTLPMIEDPSTNSKLGDSFDIAAYLQKTYPDSGAGDLFPPQTLDYEFKNDTILIPLSEIPQTGHPEYAKFNVHVDAVFTTFVQLSIACFPFDPATAEISKAEMARRAGVPSWDFFQLKGDAREKTKAAFRDALGELGKLFLKDTSGPFILGNKASYADMIVGGWLHMMHATLADDEWQELKGWHNGLYGQLYDALEVYAEMK
ncbi:uncharacterized protein N7469_001381 [Penicillium citrinum]|uniref:GST N-terminal domain-containing protein n=1 Tax=Penicillium citrinum TaxID=5077 RepID=A0A9W9TWA4_PENCI|nr:uncharacterized protein N7469_001381 [Penicillium citrinum]KAJ5243054.1 hypothetical protein N7469_001381 [Penicillium citrinum]